MEYHTAESEEGKKLVVKSTVVPQRSAPDYGIGEGEGYDQKGYLKQSQHTDTEPTNFSNDLINYRRLTV